MNEQYQEPTPLRGGTAVFTVTAIPLSDNNGNGSAPTGDPDDPSTQNPDSANASPLNEQKNKLAETVTVRGSWTTEIVWHGINGSDGDYHWTYIWNWDEKTGGYASWTHTEPTPGGPATSGLQYWVDVDGVERFERWIDDPEFVTSTTPVDLGMCFWPGFDVKKPLANGALHEPTPGYTFDITAGGVKVEYRPGGKAVPGRKNLFVASGSANEAISDVEGMFQHFWRTPFVPSPENIEPTEIFVPGFGKYLDADGRAYKALPEGVPVDVTYCVDPDRPYYTFAPELEKRCLPRKITFEDPPRSSQRPFHCKLQLDAVCNDNTNAPLASLVYWCDVDVNGGVTIGKSGDGSAGSCGVIVPTTFVEINATPNDSRAGVLLIAYYIGCCDGNLRWRQRVLEDSHPPSGKTPPYDDYIEWAGSGPFYYPDTSVLPGLGMDAHTSDYIGPCPQ